MGSVRPLYITRATGASAVGAGLTSLAEALRNGRSGLSPNAFGQPVLTCWTGAVANLDAVPLPADLATFDCRNNRLAELGLGQDDFPAAVEALKQRHDPTRIGLFLGTSTSGSHTTEIAFHDYLAHPAWPADYRYRETHDLHSVTAYVRRRLGLRGPAHTVSTACSSSAKVFADAHRYIDAGLCDAAIVGGVDSLCLTTLYGFDSLELVSRSPCRPLDAARDGISIGEAAGFMILEREPQDADDVLLSGFGESSDAHHISTPHPDGAGAAAAMAAALKSAGLRADHIDYINLHGTGTPNNDRSEAAAIRQLFGRQVACSSTKAWTGHTLGAAGITEALIVWLALRTRWMPGTLNLDTPDPDLDIDVLSSGRDADLRHAMSNSFGFGGSNCALVFSRP